MRFTQTQIPIMKNKSSTKPVRHSLLTRRNPATAGQRRFEGGFISLRALLALFLCFTGVALAIFSGKDVAVRPASEPDRYMPVPGAGSHSEADGLAQLEQYWHDRLTYPTGRFDPAWVRAAAAQHDRMTTGVPAGQHLKLDRANPNALSTTNFTALGPQPLRMTGCTGCFDYTKTEGRVNAIAVDPTTTVNGSIVAYSASVGGGVWKTTNCCSDMTTWTAVT